MSLLVLLALVLCAAVLCAVAAVAPEGGRAAVTQVAGAAALCVVFLTVRASGPASVPLPAGPAFGSPSVAIDAIGLALALPMVLGLFASATLSPAASPAGFALCGAGVLVLVTAGDALLLLLGVLLLGVALYGRAVETVLLVLLAAGSLALLAPEAGLGADGDAFPVLRALGHGAAGARAAAPLLACLAAIVFVACPPRALPDAAGLAAAAGVLLLFRLGLDLPATPSPAAGVLALVAGFAIAAAAARAALLAIELPELGRGLVRGGAGLALGGAGLVLLARGTDLVPLAASASGAVVLILLMLVLAGPLAAAAAASVASEAGSVRFAALGGLARAMPRVAVLLALSLATLGVLPLTAGFPGVWLVFELALARTHLGGTALPIGAVIAVGMLALLAGLLQAAAFRAGVVVLLGRPRTPRGAAASDLSPRALRAPFAVACVLCLLALFPGPVLASLGPFEVALSGQAAETAGWLATGAGAGAAVLSPPALLGLAALAVAIVGLGARRLPGARRAPRATPGWDGGAPPPPEWLPFGEPLAQLSAPSLARPLLEWLGHPPEQALPGEARAAGALRRPPRPLRRLRIAASRLNRLGARACPGGLDAALAAAARPALALLAVASLLAWLGGLPP